METPPRLGELAVRPRRLFGFDAVTLSPVANDPHGASSVRLPVLVLRIRTNMHHVARTLSAI
jgi:hypothetical protein